MKKSAPPRRRPRFNRSGRIYPGVAPQTCPLNPFPGPLAHDQERQATNPFSAVVPGAYRVKTRPYRWRYLRERGQARHSLSARTGSQGVSHRTERGWKGVKIA